MNADDLKQRLQNATDKELGKNPGVRDEVEKKFTLYDMARPDMTPEAKAIFMEALKLSCKDQAETLRKAKKLEKKQ